MPRTTVDAAGAARLHHPVEANVQLPDNVSVPRADDDDAGLPKMSTILKLDDAAEARAIAADTTAPLKKGGAPLAEPLAAAATLAGTDDDSVIEGNAPLSEPRAASTSPAGASDYSRPQVDEDDVVPRSPSGERLDRIKAELIAAELHRPAPQPPGYWPLARAARKAAIVAAQAVAGEEDLLGPPDPDAAEGDAPDDVLIAHGARKAHEDSELPRQQQKALEARGLAAPEKKA